MHEKLFKFVGIYALAKRAEPYRAVGPTTNHIKCDCTHFYYDIGEQSFLHTFLHYRADDVRYKSVSICIVDEMRSANDDPNALL